MPKRTRIEFSENDRKSYFYNTIDFPIRKEEARGMGEVVMTKGWASSSENKKAEILMIERIPAFLF